MSDFYEPFEKLIQLVVMGQPFQVPENNLLLRQLQYVAPDIGAGRYCWNGECRYCEINYRPTASAAEQPALACRVRGLEGMQITKLSFEMKYNMSEALKKGKP